MASSKLAYQLFYGLKDLVLRAQKINITTKEYILVIEGTAPATSYKAVTHPTSPCVLSDGQVVEFTADRVGKGWVSHIFVRPAVPLLSLLYILW